MRGAITRTRPALPALVVLATGAPATAPAQDRSPAAGSGTLSAPGVVATKTHIPLRGDGLAPGARVTIERARRGGGWRALAVARATSGGVYRVRVRPRRLASRYRLRGVAAGGLSSRAVRVRSRDVTLDAVGDINLGDGAADVMAVRGVRFPWSVGGARAALGRPCRRQARMRGVDSRAKVPGKQYNFRGRPGALRPRSATPG